MRGTATRDQSIRDVLKPLREWETLPVEPPEADPEGEDLDALAGLG